MNVALRKRLTTEEFVAWEERQELRFEFDGIAPQAMTGGTIAHATVQNNLIGALSAGLAGTPCRVFGSPLTTEVAGSIRYPDAFVVCTPQDRDARVVRDPVVIFEVLSETTGEIDRIVKNREYRATPSVRRIVILEHCRIGATVFARAGADWVGHVLAEGDELAMPEIGVTLPMATLYDGIAFAPGPDVADAEAAEGDGAPR